MAEAVQNVQDAEISESFDENLKRIQSRDRVARANMVNSAKRVAGTYMSLNGVSKADYASQKQADMDVESKRAREEQLMSGTEELPPFVSRIMDVGKECTSLGKKFKFLPYDFKVDKLNPVSILSGVSMGFISKDNPIAVEVAAIKSMFEQEKSGEASSVSENKKTVKAKTLPEQYYDNTDAFVQTKHQFEEAVENAAKFIVSDDNPDLAPMFDESTLGKEPVVESGTEITAEDILSGAGLDSLDLETSFNNMDVVARGHEEFFNQIQANGQKTAEDMYGLG